MAKELSTECKNSHFRRVLSTTVLIEAISRTGVQVQVGPDRSRSHRSIAAVLNIAMLPAPGSLVPHLMRGLPQSPPLTSYQRTLKTCSYKRCTARADMLQQLYRLALPFLDNIHRARINVH